MKTGNDLVAEQVHHSTCFCYLPTMQSNEILLYYNELPFICRIPLVVALIVFYRFTGLTSATIPNSVTSIGENAFGGCNSLTSATIPESVTSIGDAAFAYTSLTTVTIPNSVTSIGNWAFTQCVHLTSVTIPNSVTSIGYSAFSYTDLTSVTIPSSVTSIGEVAFNGCPRLTSIEVDESNPAYSSMDGILYDKEKTTLITFPAGKAVTSLIIPGSVTSIEHHAFYCCHGLTAITIPNSVTSIGDYAFYYCGFTSITIPNSVTSIGENALGYCTDLTSIYMVSPQPPVTDKTALDGVNSSCVIYVPTGSREAYTVTEPWNKFTIKEYEVETGINSVNATAPTAVGYYDLNGRRLDAPAKGLHIVHYSDGTTRKVFGK